MNRTAKKCLIASGVLHGTLAVTLLFVSGFADSDRRVAGLGDSKEITIFQAPVEESVSNPSPNTGKVVEQPIRPTFSAPQPPTESRVPFKLVPWKGDSHLPSQPERNNQPNVQTSVDTVLDAIRNRASGPVDVKIPGGKSAANQELFEETLRRIYFNSWQQPSDAASDDAVVKVAVTVASDGTVTSARISKSSGDAAVDRSVERLLKDVTRIAPFPESWKESQRQFQLSFSLKAKRSLG